MKSTLAELSTLISRWELLRKQRPAENDFTPWSYSGIKAEDIDGMFNAWKQALETAVSRTRAADQPEERIIDATVSKLMRETRPHIDNAASNGMGWLIQSTPFMANVASMAAHLSVVLAKRSDLRKALLKIAASNLNDNILSVEKVASIAQKIIVHHEKIEEQKATIDAAVKVAETTDEELAAVKDKVLADQTAVAALLASATKNQADLKIQADTLHTLVETSQTTLDEIKEQKADADKKIATGTELLANANEQLTKALQDINRQGLAGAFAAQADKVSGERLMWVGAFCASIGWLIFVAYSVISGTPGPGTPVFDPNSLLRGLPFAAPAIWLGWFSARQIGILARIQQDYAYKASTAVAFEGYKKEVASANDQALSKQLLETAVTNFGENPVRLYEKKSDDHGHPVEALVEKIKDADTRNFVVEIFKALKPEIKK
jgi:murein DD-endopeptidase MepM/ murein hydrolase activator NlpD